MFSRVWAPPARRCSKRALTVPDAQVFCCPAVTGPLYLQAYASPSSRSSSSFSSSGAAQGNSVPRSIYPASRAAERSNPHAAPLFHHANIRKIPLEAKETPSSTFSSHDIASLRNATSDPELKQLYTNLGNVVDDNNVSQAIRLASLIRERKQKMQHVDHGSAVRFEPEEKVVFLALMRALSYHGLLDETQSVFDDMLRCGFTECIDSLNCLLQAATVSAQVAAADDILHRIARLPSQKANEPSQPSSTSRLSDMVFRSRSTNLALSDISELQLPWQYVRNWNATTCAHLIDEACQSHNLEYALLISATCFRLGESLPPKTLLRLISLCLHSNEFRIAVELAERSGQGGLRYNRSTTTPELASDQSVAGTEANKSAHMRGHVARRLAPSTWMSILRSCAEGGYLPGVELAWHRAVVKGLLAPDEGLMLSVLALAAKEGSVQMATVCLRYLDPLFDPATGLSTGVGSAGEGGGQMTKTRRRELQEWHLSALFEAQCSAGDFEGALRTVQVLHRRGVQVTHRTTARLSTAIYQDAAALESAAAAVEAVGADPNAGTSIQVVDAIIDAAVWRRDLPRAIAIYRRIPELHAIKPSIRPLLRPNLYTFHTLFSACIDARDRDIGQALLHDLNSFKIKPTATTYERLILLCLTQPSYQDAFAFIEEAKAKEIVPSRKSYEVLLRKCYADKDPRLVAVYEDMQDAGYHLNKQLQRELGLDNLYPPSRYVKSRDSD